MEEFLSLKEVQKKLGYSSPTSVRNLIGKGSLINSKKVKGKWLISKEELDSFLEGLNNKEYFTLKEAADKLNKDPQYLASLCKRGVIFPNAKKHSRLWKIPIRDITEYQMQLEADAKKDYYTRKDISNLLSVQAVTVTRLITNGSISNNIKKLRVNIEFQKLILISF
ncbi:helix-turn-helix domain-containing protein [Lysinibacillus sp. JK80]|uniref:helix-turn-helix domain-containing protein n=1 Tax=Lysinibacillus sp. JK80 TaxID=2749809 RepID=UPI0022B99D24|nr:helix-turn-helix domain-containing protein [Lysinibacillus sp. JK80]WBF56755.1 helix-turn-helix domain-containing protein [Lysinibacillus sp. JK80]